MRFVWLFGIGLAGCGGGEPPACPSGVELGEADAGCACGGATFALGDNGQVCACEDGALSCEPVDTGASTFCRSISGDCE